MRTRRNMTMALAIVCALLAGGILRAADKPARSWSPKAPSGAASDSARAEFLARAAEGIGKGVVFVKTGLFMPAQQGNDMGAHRLGYGMLDLCPAPRAGLGLYVLTGPLSSPKVVPLVEGKGWVSDPKVGYDGRRILFSMCPEGETFFHIFEMNADGSGLKQLTFGDVDDVCPCYLPDDRIAFSSNRCGYRDEYHGHMVENLHTMNGDGSDIRQISFYNNDEWEPSVGNDGRILFGRWQVFNMRNKVELMIHTMLPDGTGDDAVFGPEIRGNKSMYKGMNFSRPQQLPDGRIACSAITLFRNDFDHQQVGGATRRLADGSAERTSCGLPWPLSNGLLLVTFVAETQKEMQEIMRRRASKGGFNGRTGIGVLDPDTGQFEVLYEDPQAACFDAVAIAPRKRPPVLASRRDPKATTGRFMCLSAYTTRDKWAKPGRPYYVQATEIIPATTSTANKNHLGGLGRVLGRAPIAADGSFHIEVPADTSLALQITDADGFIEAAMHTWIYVRGGETKSCKGCHEMEKVRSPVGALPLAAARPQQLSAERPLLRYRMRSLNVGMHPPLIAPEENRLIRSQLFNRTWADLPLYRAHLGHADARVRQSAAEAIGFLRARDCAAELAAALGDRSALVRREAAMSLAPCGNRGSVAPLIEALDDEDWGVRRAAYLSLVWLTAQDLPLDAEADPQRRREQVRAWGQWWQRDGGAWHKTLLARLDGADDDAAIAAARALGLLECSQAAPVLRNWVGVADPVPLTERNTRDRRQIVAMEALGHLKDAASVPALLALLPEPALGNKEIRAPDDVLQRERITAAAHALGTIGDSRAAERLLLLTNRPPRAEDVEIMVAMMGALARLPTGECRKHLKGAAVIGNVPGDGDRMLAFEDDATERYTACLTEREGFADDAIGVEMRLLGKDASQKPLPAEPNGGRVAGNMRLMVFARDPAIAPYIAAQLTSKDSPVNGFSAMHLARALGKCRNPAVVPDLIELLRDTPAEAELGFTKREYLYEAAKAGQGPSDEYLAPRPRFKVVYCVALGVLGDERAVPALGEVLNDPRHVLDTRYAAAVALGMIGSPKAIEPLRRAKEMDIHYIVRRACNESLGVVTGERPYAAVLSDFPPIQSAPPNATALRKPRTDRSP